MTSNRPAMTVLNVTLAPQVNATREPDPFNGTELDIMAVYQTYAPLSVALDRFATLIFYCIGIPCNPLCAFIWLGRHTRRNNSSAIYLAALSISHTVFLVLHIFNDLNYAWGVNTLVGQVSCELFFTVYYCAQYLAPLLVLGFTVERYVAICYPFAKERYCTVRRAVLVVLTLLVFCLLLSCMQAYIWTFDYQYAMCNHREAVRDTTFVELWNWLTELTLFGVAPLAALLFNILVIREIRSITTRGPAVLVGGGRGAAGSGGGGQNQASTVMLLTVSFYLICTWLPATLVYSLEREFSVQLLELTHCYMIAMTPKCRRHFTYINVRKCAEEVALSNSACYFFIYCLTGRYFRDRFRRLLCPRRCSRSGAANGSTTYTAANGRSHAAAVTHSQYLALACKVADNGHNDGKAQITSV